MKEKLTYNKMKKRLDNLLADIKGEKLVGSANDEKRRVAYNKAFWSHMKNGMQQNILSEGNDGSGGFLVPDEYDKRLIEALKEKNVLRQLATTIQTKHKLKIPLSIDDARGHWVDEGEPYLFDDLEFGQIIIDAFKLGTMMLASDEILADSEFDIEEYIEQRFVNSLADSEEEAFIKGDGYGKPYGLIYQTPVGTESDTLNIDSVLDLVYSVRSPYRKNGVLLMSDEACRELRKEKAHNGKPAWEGSLIEGEPLKLLGYPVFVSKALDGIASGNTPVLFGDFSYYWISERGKRVIKRLSERFADSGQISYITFERVDAKLVLPESIKALKIK